MDETPYTRDEVLAAGNTLPERGLECHCCHATIPVFAELSEKDESRVRHLIRNNRNFMAMTELRAATGLFVAVGEVVGDARRKTQRRGDNDTLSILRVTVAHITRETMSFLPSGLARSKRCAYTWRRITNRWTRAAGACFAS